MEEILQKLNEAMGLLQNKIKDYTYRSAKLDTQDADLVARAKEIIARENKIGPAEDVLKLRQQAILEKSEADAMLKASRQDRDAVNKYVIDEKSAIQKERDQIRIDRAKADSDMSKAQKEWINLKKEQESWKAKFMEEIRNKVK